VQAQLLQARPEVVGVVVELLDLASTTVSAVLTLWHKCSKKQAEDEIRNANRHEVATDSVLHSVQLQESQTKTYKMVRGAWMKESCTCYGACHFDMRCF
jgi:hypothetical protein